MRSGRISIIAAAALALTAPACARLHGTAQGAVPNACHRLPIAAAARVLGTGHLLKLVKGYPVHSATSSQCLYLAPGLNPQEAQTVSLSISPGDASLLAALVDNQTLGAAPESISGVGEGALWRGGDEGGELLATAKGLRLELGVSHASAGAKARAITAMRSALATG